MLLEIMQHKGGEPSRKEALETLKTEAQPKPLRDWPVFLMVAFYGVASATLGYEYLMVFLFAAACLAMAMHRLEKRRSDLVRAVLALLDQTDEAETDPEPAQQDDDANQIPR